MNTDILARIREADNATTPAAPRLTDTDLHAAIDTLMEADAPKNVAPLKRGRPRRSLAVAASAALVAGGLVLSPVGMNVADQGVPGISWTQGGASAQASELLGKAADLTPADPETKAGQYWQITVTEKQRDTHLTDNTSTMVTKNTERTEWVSVDGAGPRYTAEEVSFEDGAAPTTRRMWTTSPEAQGAASWQNLSREFLASRPRDVTELRDELYSVPVVGGITQNQQVFLIVNDALSSGMAPAELRASLLRVLQDVNGVEVTDPAVVMDGRKGVAFGMAAPKEKVAAELVVDPQTGTVIGNRATVTQDMEGEGTGTQYKKGHVLTERVVLRELVDAVPQEVVNGATTADQG